MFFLMVLRNTQKCYCSFLLFTNPLGPSLQLPHCPCRGDGFAMALPGVTPRCRQARQPVPPFFPHQPACSHHRLLPAEVFAHLWASWNMGLVQVKVNPTKTTSDAERQHTKGTGILSRERQSSLSAAAPAYAKRKWWQLQADLPHHRLSPNIPQIIFFAWQAFPLPVPIY